RAGSRKRAAGTEIAGIFEPDGVTRVEQHPHRKVEGGLRTDRDDYLIGSADDATRCADIGGNRLAQGGHTLPRFIAEQRLARIAAMTCEKAAPEKGGKFVYGRQAMLEGLAVAARIARRGAPRGRKRLSPL